MKVFVEFTEFDSVKSRWNVIKKAKNNNIDTPKIYKIYGEASDIVDSTL